MIVIYLLRAFSDDKLKIRVVKERQDPVITQKQKCLKEIGVLTSKLSKYLYKFITWYNL